MQQRVRIWAHKLEKYLACGVLPAGHVALLALHKWLPQIDQLTRVAVCICPQECSGRQKQTLLSRHRDKHRRQLRLADPHKSHCVHVAHKTDSTTGMLHGDAVAVAVVAPLLRQPAPTAGQVQLLVHALRDRFPLDSLPCLLTAAAQVPCWEEGHVAVLQAVLGRQPVLCEVGLGVAAAGVVGCIPS